MCQFLQAAADDVTYRAKSVPKAALNVDIRNLITHNRGVVNQFFFQRGLSCGPRRTNRFRGLLGRCQDLGTFVYRARQLDLRAIEKFKLKTLSQIPGPRVVTK